MIGDTGPAPFSKKTGVSAGMDLRACPRTDGLKGDPVGQALFLAV
jgi:hypothetical protein